MRGDPPEGFRVLADIKKQRNRRQNDACLEPAAGSQLSMQTYIEPKYHRKQNRRHGHRAHADTHSYFVFDFSDVTSRCIFLASQEHHYAQYRGAEDKLLSQCVERPVVGVDGMHGVGCVPLIDAYARDHIAVWPSVAAPWRKI